MALLTAKPAWAALQNHYDNIHNQSLVDSFKNDLHRHEKFSIMFNDILFDYSKNRINDDTLPLLIELAKESKLSEKMRAMFSGEKINITEGRAVLHTALRNRSNTPIYVDGVDVMPQINASLKKMRAFSERIRSGEWKG